MGVTKSLFPRGLGASVLSIVKRISFAHFGLGPHRRAQTVFPAHAAYFQGETQNQSLKSTIEVTFQDQNSVKTLAFEAQRGRFCQKFIPPSEIEHCFQLGIVNPGVPHRRCLDSGAFYGYQPTHYSLLTTHYSARFLI